MHETPCCANCAWQKSGTSCVFSLLAENMSIDNASGQGQIVDHSDNLVCPFWKK